ncbi:cell filamentation protein Fic [Achromobacter spanius]|uniref:hypothetical protein n=1 Tax=Achromobacter spanius TaxID=217203 RepID=UPI000C2B8336|nr:hypothetical protein [Achromobacter spanius]AUA54573.1 hypothetical protein CVS48_00115 [Achromobacter spanius]CAB3651206.1 hypothetical protein LMG5911_02458 [Achromobacter spanius]SPT39840.1 cell filamentation protein Fic [Achromobacter denitrificans]VEE58034.1 cell filamentation protein Fic [Achromobacter spanius]
MKYTGQDGDPYLDKGTGILRNLLGIQDQAALDKAESSLSFLQAAKLREQPVAGKFDLEHNAGYDIDWTGISQAEMIRASIDAYNGNADSLARLIRQGIHC